MHRFRKNNAKGSSRRGVGAVAVISALAFAATSCGGDSSTEAGAGGETGTGGEGDDLGKIRVALVCGGMTPMAAQLAINGDTFPESLEVEKLCFDSGSDAVQALIGGSLDVFMGSTEHVISTQEQGLPTRGYAGINNRAPYALLTEANSDVESAGDLADETVGVTSPGSLSDTELHIAAQKNDVDYDSMQVIGAGSGAPMASAIKQGRIAAGMVSEPQRSELLQSGDYRLIWEPEFDYASIIAVSNSEWVGENEATMKAFLEGLTAAAKKAKSEEDWALETMKAEKFPVSDEVLAAATEGGLETIPEDLVVSESVFDNTTQLLVGVGRLEEGAVPPYDEVFNFSYLPDAP